MKKVRFKEMLKSEPKKKELIKKIWPVQEDTTFSKPKRISTQEIQYTDLSKIMDEVPEIVKFKKQFPNKVTLITRGSDPKIRKLKRMMFNAILNDQAKLRNINMSSAEINNLSKYLERGCYHKALEKAEERSVWNSWNDKVFSNMYHGVCYEVAVNIDNTSSVQSSHLADKIFNNEIEVVKIAPLHPKDMCPERHIEVLLKIQKRLRAGYVKKHTKMYTCYNCGSKKCTIEKRQNRALDEGASSIVTCQVCENEWSV